MIVRLAEVAKKSSSSWFGAGKKFYHAFTADGSIDEHIKADSRELAKQLLTRECARIKFHR